MIPTALRSDSLSSSQHPNPIIPHHATPLARFVKSTHKKTDMVTRHRWRCKNARQVCFFLLYKKLHAGSEDS